MTIKLKITSDKHASSWDVNESFFCILKDDLKSSLSSNPSNTDNGVKKLHIYEVSTNGKVWNIDENNHDDQRLPSQRIFTQKLISKIEGPSASFSEKKNETNASLLFFLKKNLFFHF